MSNYDAFCEYEEEISRPETIRYGDVTHIVCRDQNGNRDYDDEMVINSYYGELMLDDRDFAND